MRFDRLETSEREIVLVFRDVSRSDVSHDTPPQTTL